MKDLAENGPPAQVAARFGLNCIVGPGVAPWVGVVVDDLRQGLVRQPGVAETLLNFRVPNLQGDFEAEEHGTSGNSCKDRGLVSAW